MPPRLKYIVLFAVILFVTPLLTSILNFWFFKEVMLTYSGSLEMLKTGKIHYGFAKYLTYVFQFVMYFFTIRYLLKRYVIFDFEAKNFNQTVIVFIILLSSVLLEYLLEGISNKGQWWVYVNYVSQKEFWNLELGIFMIPAFLEAAMIYGFLLIFAKLSDLDPILKSVKNIMLKTSWSEQELQEVLSYRYEKFFISEEYELVAGSIEMKRGKKVFYYHDLKKFDKVFEKKDSIL
jgi:hypothetical protein